MSKWKKVKIGDLFNLEKGSLQSSKCTKGDYDFITASSEWKKHNEYTHETEALIVAVAASGSLGRVHYVNGKFISSDLCFILTPKNPNKYPVDLEFYFHIFRSIRDDLVKKTATGTSKLAMNKKNFSNYELPYFGIGHQKNFCGKLISIERKKGQLQANSNYQQSHLTLLRQQILQDAISGKLTADWRAKNPEKITGECSAEHLLAAIKAEKKKLIAEKKIKKEKPLPPIAADEVPFDVPNGWEWCRLGGVFASTSGATPTRGDNNFWKDGSINWLKSGEMNDGIIDSESEEKITKKGFEKSSTFLFPKETVLIAMYGATAGKLAILNIESTTNQAICGFLKNNFIEQKFLFYFLKVVRKKMVAESWGQAQPNISQTYLKSFLFPLPPRAEQKAIVAKVESLFAYLSQLEEKIQHNAMSAEHLMQAFLGEVFRK